MHLKIHLRLYKRYDIDLLALYGLGISIGEIAKEALIAYANGKEYKVYISPSPSHEFKDPDRFRLTFHVNDPAVEKLLRQIRKTYRNTFIKCLIRESLIRQNLGIFMESKAYAEAEAERVREYDLTEHPQTLVKEAKEQSRHDQLLKRRMEKETLENEEVKPKGKKPRTASAPQKQTPPPAMPSKNPKPEPETDPWLALNNEAQDREAQDRATFSQFQGLLDGGNSFRKTTAESA